jgi:hypothetical protein
MCVKVARTFRDRPMQIIITIKTSGEITQGEIQNSRSEISWRKVAQSVGGINSCILGGG